jgi:hypothetical protein
MRVADDEEAMEAMQIRSQGREGEDKENGASPLLRGIWKLLHKCCSKLLQHAVAHPRYALVVGILLFTVLYASTGEAEKPTPLKTKYDVVEAMEFKAAKSADVPTYPCIRHADCVISCHHEGHCCGQTCTCSNVYSKAALEVQNVWHREHCVEQATFCAHAMCGREEVHWVAECKRVHTFDDGHCIAKKVALIRNEPKPLPKPVCIEESKACSNGKTVKRHIDYQCDFEPCS